MFPSKERIDDVCANLSQHPNGQTAEVATELIRHMEKCMNELMQVSPTFVQLVGLMDEHIRLYTTSSQDGMGFTGVEIDVKDQSGQRVAYENVPVGSKPYMEVLRLLISMRQRDIKE